MDLKSKIILISGPTASGKSSFALKLAKKIDGEIINADSMQIYKEFKILTARPNIKEYSKIKHHLYGFQNVKKNFSSGDWLKLAKKKIIEVKKRKKIPIFVGGTGLYFKSLTDGLVKIPKIPIKLRNKIRLHQKKIGQENFYKKLLKIDPSIKNKINPTDTQRSIRAYEIKTFTKKSINEWFKKTKSEFSKSDFYMIFIDFPRSEIIRRIQSRTNEMIKKGAVSEVKDFLKLKIREDITSSKVIGVKEIKEFIQNNINLNELNEKISIKTRQYAKRQSTWARGHMSDWQKIKPNELNKFLKKL